MLKRNDFYLIFLSLLGFVLTTTEFLFHFKHTSLCSTEGCKIASFFVKSEPLLLTSGILLFAVLVFLSIFRFRWSDSLINLAIVIALVVEGYLVGFQLFVMKTICILCLSIATIVFLLALSRLFVYKEKIILSGFALFAVQLFLVYFINPSVDVLPNNECVLIYSRDCPSCKRVIESCIKNNIQVSRIDVGKVKGVCRSLGLSNIPILICSESKNKKVILQGEEVILDYLAGLTSSSASAEVGEISESNPEVRKEKILSHEKVQKRNETIQKQSDKKKTLETSSESSEERGVCSIISPSPDCNSK